MPQPDQRLRVLVQPLHPAQLVVEFRTRLRVAVGQIEAADDDAVDCRLDVAAMVVVRIARQAAPVLHRLDAAGQDRHAVPERCPCQTAP